MKKNIKNLSLHKESISRLDMEKLYGAVSVKLGTSRHSNCTTQNDAVCYTCDLNKCLQGQDA